MIVMIHDPFVRQEEIEFNFTHDLESVLTDADAIIIVTSHQMYKELDLNKTQKIMKEKPILIDGRVTYEPEDAINAGFVYRGIGRGQSFH